MQPRVLVGVVGSFLDRHPEEEQFGVEERASELWRLGHTCTSSVQRWALSNVGMREPQEA